MSAGNSTVTYKDVPGFPGYRAGSDGSVWTAWHRGKKPFVTATFRKLKPLVTDRGYSRVRLYRGGKGRFHFVHRLILEAFVGPCPDGCQTCHFPDRDPANNRLKNLRWGTRKDNAADRDQHGNALRGTRHPAAKLTEKDVRAIRAKFAADGTRGCKIRLARKYHVDPALVTRIINRVNWPHIS